MTEQAMNVAIAEACLWTNVSVYEGSVTGIRSRFRGWERADFTSNLNQIHEAVSTLTFTQRRLYRLELQRVMSSGLKDGVLVEMSECIDATARQRAEAFLRALGRWSE